MIDGYVSADDAIKFLNGLMQIDPAAVRGLFAHRVKCNDALADHPTVQVRGYGPDHPNVSILGVLNGLFGAMGEEAGKLEGYGYITAVYSKSGVLERFQRTEPSGE